MSNSKLSILVEKNKSNLNSRSLRDQLKTDIAKLKEAQPTFNPKLALIQVGTRSDSSSYIRLKQKAAVEV